jgi:geranylgeranyl pyrophosphate synthase
MLAQQSHVVHRCFKRTWCCASSTGCKNDVAYIPQVDLKRYTTETYMRIVTFKTAYYSFYLPVACGLLIGGVSDDASLELAKDICVRMGQYFQVLLLPPAKIQ